MNHLRDAQNEIDAMERERPDPADLIIENPSPEARRAIQALIDSRDFDIELLRDCGAHFDTEVF